MGGHDHVPGAALTYSLSPSAFPDQVLPSARDMFAVEQGLRAATTEMGSKSGVAGAPLPRKILAAYGVPHSVSQAWRIGRAVARCRRDNDLKGIPRAILELQNGACLFVGKVVDVQRVRLLLAAPIVRRS